MARLARCFWWVAVAVAGGLAGCQPTGEHAAILAPITEQPTPASSAVTALQEDLRAEASPQGVARHAVVIVLDTLRGDAVAKAETPTLDALAARGMRVDRAWTTGTWTVPAVISLFTGAFVRTHGWDLSVGELETRPLPDLPTLAEVLHQQGFQTQGLYANAYLAYELGFSRGFDQWKRTTDSRMAAQVMKTVATWERAEAAGDVRRHFLYIHLLGPHSGLAPSEAARQRWGIDPKWFADRNGLLIGRAKRGLEEGVRGAYQRAYHAVVEDTDARLGEILAALAPYLSDAVLVVVADHGEELGENGVFGHGWSVAESLTHVPMYVVAPGVAPSSRETATLAEVTDLVTDLLGVAHGWPVQTPWSGPLVSERHGKTAVLVDGRWKGAWFKDELKTYDLALDPAGLVPAQVDPALVLQARQRWSEQVPAAASGGSTVPLSTGTLESLRVLGYLE